MSMDAPVRWEDLLPAEFEERLARYPVCYMPMGLCEPHGHIAPFGLDTHKAVYLCEEAARRFGGIVAPTMAYHVHETGFHAPWLTEVMGSINPRLAALPPLLVYETLLYQLRAFRNAGFRGVAVISGHNGTQDDLRNVGRAFAETFPIDLFICSDPELVTGQFIGDHAGSYEVSQLLAIRPDLIDLSRAARVASDPLGGFAQNPDAVEASVEQGEAILEASLGTIKRALDGFKLVRIP